ncbi:potassium channel family protein [Histidinibacterium lentulum]|uniref:Two pore domain potassium channel family protein n=1 Tax=Histidinibacterium lentulum TaxID=2480588 RepID=A0A3N2R7M6_9RHOB|nr:potassium channel family protein [Histidinibacterium lentulum]ROU03326.1 two pore domain potassium channel family protein [Histidinibacterium lentulum]
MSAMTSLFRGLADAFSSAKVRSLLAFTFALIALATVVFWLLEDWSLLQAAFFAVATISTVGYGDVVPETVAGRIFCMVYILVGLGVFVAAATAVAEALIARREQDLSPGGDRDGNGG